MACVFLDRFQASFQGIAGNGHKCFAGTQDAHEMALGWRT
jgi:hypothetical protein